MHEFDYVIVGAGSAGCVLAYRIAEKGHSVCVLEAGPSDTSPYIRIPAGFMKTYTNPALTWQFTHTGTPEYVRTQHSICSGQDPRRVKRGQRNNLQPRAVRRL